jgi:hypothetical protein
MSSIAPDFKRQKFDQDVLANRLEKIVESSLQKHLKEYEDKLMSKITK